MLTKRHVGSGNEIDLLVNEGGLFLIECNYDIIRLTISAIFYRELLDRWSKLREVKDPDNIYKYQNLRHLTLF